MAVAQSFKHPLKNNFGVGTRVAIARFMKTQFDATSPSQPPPLGVMPTARPDFSLAHIGYTTGPIQAGEIHGTVPEFCRIKTATAHTGLSRGKIYAGINEGWVKSVSLRKPGQKFSVRLIHLPALLSHLRKLLEEQN
jgi:hypothetical protein